MRDLITQYRRRHAIDQIASDQDNIPPKTLRNCMVEEKSEFELSQLSDNFFAQPPHFGVECKHKKTNEESHRRIKRQRKGQRGIPRQYHCVR